MTVRRIHVETVPLEARSFHGRPAGLVTRVLANTIDLAITVILLVAGYLAVAAVLFLRWGAAFRFPIVSYRTASLAGFVVLVVYLASSWSTSGRTYGDHVLGLRVRTRDGGDIGLARAVGRALLCASFPLLLGWVAVSRGNRSVQDLILRTMVVYDWGGSSVPATSRDASRVAVDVATPVAYEPDHAHAQPLPHLDGE